VGTNRILGVSLSIYNGHRSQGGMCRVISRVRDGSGISDSYTRSWGGGTRRLTISLGRTGAVTAGNYLVYCRLPPADGSRRSTIYNVRVLEDS
jgi:hypothetical protein